MSGYMIARTLAEALEALQGEGAVAVAGGTDLWVGLRRARAEGRALPRLIVDITRVPELGELNQIEEGLWVGAGVSFARLEADPLVQRLAPALGQAAATVGSVQVRNAATIGGNVANASPAADGLAALVGLGAEAVVASAGGERRLKVEELVGGGQGVGLAHGELIKGFVVPALEGRQVFLKVGRRAALNIARLSVTVVLGQEVRVGLGACFPAPRRITHAEELAAKGDFEEAARAAAEAFRRESGSRPSAVYKIPAISRAVREALKIAAGGVA